MYQADEIPLIRGEGAVSGRHRTTEEGDRMTILNQHRPETVGCGITLDDEGLGEVRHRQDRRYGDRGLECVEGRGRLLAPREPFLLVEGW